MNGWTPTEQRIWDLLKDGRSHHRDEVLACLGDTEADRNDLAQHLTRMRKRLRPKDKEIVCILRGYAVHFRLVKTLANDE